MSAPFGCLYFFVTATSLSLLPVTVWSLCHLLCRAVQLALHSSEGLSVVVDSTCLLEEVSSGSSDAAIWTLPDLFSHCY